MKFDKEYITVKDHLVSGETFRLLLDPKLEMLKTTPQPNSDVLSSYYKSKDYISHSNNSSNAFELVYQLIRKGTIRKKVTLINTYGSHSKTLLDVGCGIGDFLKLAQKKGWNVLGIEPNHNARIIANKKTNNSVYNIGKLTQLEQNTFSVITLWHVLEHLPNLDKQIKTLKKLLKPEGVLIIAVPNFKSFDAQYYKSHWAAYDVPRHLWHFSRNAIKMLFCNVNMNIIKTIPLFYDSYYVSLLSEKYKFGFMNPFKSFWIGFQSNLKAKSTKEYSSLIYVIRNNK